MLKELLKLDTSNAVGIDDLHPRLLKTAAPHIARILTVLFNCSLEKGCVPNEFKVAKITPIHKGGNRMELRKYRPISVLPTISKIFEKAIHEQVYTYFNKHSLLSERQSGFRPGHSTLTCLTELVENILDNMDNSQITGAIFLDLKRAFDLIPHDLILQKMSLYGIRGVDLEWIESYF